MSIDAVMRGPPLRRLRRITPETRDHREPSPWL